jgi:hypothetical protein
MVVRIELDDANIGWTQYGPSEYIPEKMKQWLVKYVWNRDNLSRYERAESLYIVGPSKTGKTDTCYNLLNKDGTHCKVFVIDTYTNWKAFHDYNEENGLPDFVLVDDISVEELGRGWKNLFGGQKTIMYALDSRNKVTTAYGRPCIYLCNPDSDAFNDPNFSSSKISWLDDNIFGSEPIYLEQSFINGASAKKCSKYAGNIDPEIRKYIKFGEDEFELFPTVIQNRFLNKAYDKYMAELEKKLEYSSVYDSFNTEFYGSIYDSFTPHNSPTTSENSAVYGTADGRGGNAYNIENEEYYGKAADAYVEQYMQNY